jgi:hypothetical protein
MRSRPVQTRVGEDAGHRGGGQDVVIERGGSADEVNLSVDSLAWSA